MRLLKQLKDDLKNNRDIFKNPALIDGLVDMSKCPDFVVNKGHYFGTQLFQGETPLTDADKRALIAFVQTF